MFISYRLCLSFSFQLMGLKFQHLKFLTEFFNTVGDFIRSDNSCTAHALLAVVFTSRKGHCSF